MQDRQLRYMVEIGRRGSLSGAARHLGVSQPALSQFLANEEQALGTKLFIPYGNRMIPTPAGNVYITAASRMLKVRDQTYSRIMRPDPDSIRRVRIGVPNQYYDRLAARIVPSLYSSIKNIDISIKDAVSLDLSNQLDAGELDMAIIGSADSPDTPESGFVFMRCEVCILVPRVFNLNFPVLENNKEHKLLPLEELRDQPFVLPEGRSVLRGLVDRAFSEAGYMPHVSYRSDNPYVAMELAAGGFGAAFLTLNAASGADISRCRIFLMESHPCIYYGIRLRDRKDPDEVESLVIRRLLKEVLREREDFIYLNEASRRMLESEGEN